MARPNLTMIFLFEQLEYLRMPWLPKVSNQGLVVISIDVGTIVSREGLTDENEATINFTGYYKG